jgi:antitoxin VapB
MPATTDITAEKVPAYLSPAVEHVGTETSRHVRLFRNGANQAVRIPKEFELPGKEAILRREGNRLVLEAIPDRPKKGTAAALAAALESMKDWPIVDEPFPDVNEGLLPLEDIDL